MIITDIKTGEDMYGEWVLWGGKDESGNVVKKFGVINQKFKISGSEDPDELSIGDTVRFLAMVKSHKKINEVPTTLLGRVGNLKKI